MMQFHNYRSYYDEVVSRGHLHKTTRPQDELLRLTKRFLKYRAANAEEQAQCDTAGQLCIYEHIWYSNQRPYYNVWPSILDMLLELELTIPATSLVIPQPVLLVRLPETFTEFKTVFVSSISRKETAIADWHHVPENVVRRVWVGMQRFDFCNGPVNGKIVFDVYEGQSIQECMDATTSHLLVPGFTRSTLDKNLAMAMKIACGVSILAHDPEFVQPIVLNKDLPKYEEANDAVKKYLEDKAARKQGRGFSVGKDLEAQLAREQKASPHLRRPHMCLFWTGKGRTMPKIKLRRGAVIHPRELTEVPTGYLDKETTDVTTPSARENEENGEVIDRNESVRP